MAKHTRLVRACIELDAARKELREKTTGGGWAPRKEPGHGDPVWPRLHKAQAEYDAALAQRVEYETLLKEAIKIIHCHFRDIHKDFLKRAREWFK